MDFPSTVSECKLLEGYLSNYEDYTTVPKSTYELMLNDMNQIYDIRIKPQERIIKKSGIDLVFLLPDKDENECDGHYNEALYDRVNCNVYFKNEVYDEKGKLLVDKKIADNLENNVPCYPKNVYEIYKENFKQNKKGIKAFYSGFGMNLTPELDDEINEPKLIRTFTQISSTNQQETIDEIENIMFGILYKYKYNDKRLGAKLREIQKEFDTNNKEKLVLIK